MPKMKIYRIPREDGTKVPLPVYSTPGSACFDIFTNNQENIIIPAGGTVKIPTGMKVEIETGWQLKLQNRSGLGTNKNIQLAHCVGTVDEDYRGEIFIPIYNRGNRCFVVEPEMRICQGELVPKYEAEFNEVESEDELSATERGEGRFGSTGVN